MYQHRQLQRLRRQLAESNDLFHLISENAADMIAVVEGGGCGLYNSPGESTVVGYCAEERGAESSDQIHPADRERVTEAAAKARVTGRGERLEYRMRHKDGTWRTLESTASPIAGPGGDAGRLVIVNRDITDRKRMENLVSHNAFHDGLTGLPNRLLFIDRLRQAMMHARRRRDDHVAVVLVDIDEFKIVNDSLGHSAGDRLLIEVGGRLADCLDEKGLTSPTNAATDTKLEEPSYRPARFGADEFSLLLEDFSAPMDAIRMAEKIQASLVPGFVLGGHQIVVNASIGIAFFRSALNGPEDLLRDAELAMYSAKHTGKAKYELFDPAMHSSCLKRVELESELRRGLEQGELLFYYQPIISLRTGTIRGLEALSRGQRPEGLFPPAEFIPVAEETGLILPINLALMNAACRQLVEWQSAFACAPPLSMSMNITPSQFEHAARAAHIRGILEQTSSDPPSLPLQITDSLT